MTTVCDKCMGKGYIEIKEIPKAPLDEITNDAAATMPNSFDMLDDKTKTILIKNGITTHDILMNYPNNKLLALNGVGEKRAEEIKSIKGNIK